MVFFNFLSAFARHSFYKSHRMDIIDYYVHVLSKYKKLKYFIHTRLQKLVL